MGYVSFLLKKSETHVFTNKEYITVQLVSTETIFNASRVVKKFDQCCI